MNSRLWSLAGSFHSSLMFLHTIRLSVVATPACRVSLLEPAFCHRLFGSFSCHHRAAAPIRREHSALRQHELFGADEFDGVGVSAKRERSRYVLSKTERVVDGRNVLTP